MRVAKDRLLPILNLLADFLNQDFETKSWERFLEHADEHATTIRSEFGNAEGIDKAKSVQFELKHLLRVVVEGDPSERKAKELGLPRTNLYDELFELVSTLNDLELKQTWQVMPANKKAADIMGCKYVRKRTRPGEPFLEIRGSKWQMNSWSATWNSREWLFSVLGSALQNNELPRLKVCLLCKKYFVAEDLKRKFCTDECKVKFHNKSRLASGYFRKNRAMRKKRERRRQWTQDARDTASVKIFERFLKKAEGSVDDQMAVGKLVKRIPGQWRTVTPWLHRYKNDRDVKEIWRKLPQEHKELFFEYAKCGNVSVAGQG